jgi:CRISPR-associated protein Cas1
MLNELVYCPRLYYLEHVADEWEDSADTVEGRRVHRRVDRTPSPLPEADALPAERLHARSVTVASEAAGVVAKVDLIESDEDTVVPVDYKRGEAPDPESVPGGVWPADRVQVAAQVLALRDSGYRCDHGVVYYAAAKTRVAVPWTDQAGAEVRSAVAEARRIAAERVMPPPLVASSKCPRCSLVGICLPDETNLLRAPQSGPEPVDRHVRQLIPSRDDAVPLYVQAAGATVGLAGETLEVRLRDGTKTVVRTRETSHVCLFGAVHITTPAIRELCDRGVSVSFFSHGGWHYGAVNGFAEKNALLRIAQFAVAAERERRLPLAREIVAGKILNGRTLLRRNGEDLPEITLRSLKQLADAASSCASEEALLGLEGTAARLYFEAFGRLLSPRSGAAAAFDFNGRNRRPPRDPVNALLSLAYALLAKDARLALLAVGFDPTVGFYHRPRPGRPALALDLMEEFRPLVADSVVLTAVNTESVQASHFIRAAGAVALTEAGRRAFLAAYERRMDQQITHPVFGYTLSYRRVLEVQARLLARTVTAQLTSYPSFRTR